MGKQKNTIGTIKFLEMCCDNFKKFIPTFRWMKTEDGIFLLPYVPSGGDMIRVNYCPNCGAYVGDILITEKEMRDLI